MVARAIWSVLLLFLVTACSREADLGEGYVPVEGDVVFQSLPRNPLVEAIEGSTGSPFSHCGILHEVAGKWVVIEAIGPVKETAFGIWVARGREGDFAAFRLKEAWRGKIPEFVKAAQGYEGLPYDINYDLDDEKIYCSELVFKAFKKVTGEELGELRALGDLEWEPHEAVIREIEGGNLPLGRMMITPKGLSEARQLERVFENYQ